MQPGSVSTFDSFIPTAASLEALTAAGAFGAAEPRAARLLLMLGPPGTGKTHLLKAIVARARERHAAEAILLTNGEDLVQALISAIRGSTRDTIWTRFSEAAVVAIDDLHVLAGKPVTQGELGHHLRRAVDRGAQVACAAGCAASRIPILAAAVRALPAARVIEMPRPRRDQMMQILTGMARAAELTLDAKTLGSIASRCRGDVRCGIGALARVRFVASAGDRR
jgi:chromosomal replication initiation ATPase DnaA